MLRFVCRATPRAQSDSIRAGDSLQKEPALITHRPQPTTQTPFLREVVQSPGRETSMAGADVCSAGGPHVVMATVPMLGHIYPLLRFAKALVTRLQFTVTFVNNHYYHNYILSREPPSSNSCSSCNGKLHFEWVEDGLPEDYDFNDVLGRQEEFIKGCKNMQAPLKALLESLNRKHPPVSCVIFGSFFAPAHDAAKEVGIPSVFFWSQSAAVFCIYRHMPLLAANGFFPYTKVPSDCKEDDTRLVSYIPGVPPLYPEDCPTFLLVEDTSHVDLKMMERQFDLLKECNTVLINSFYELETESFKALQADSLSVFAVGPLLSSSREGETSENVESVECLKWLDTQSMHSVLYISSGTLLNPAPEDIKSIALALREMKQPFLWAIKLRSSFYNVATDTITEYRSVAEMLPQNFLEDSRQYGVVVSWAPQQEVLGHPSVGAFLTHCGWNSTLESLSMGIPMIPLPRASDQTTNSKFVIDVWKVGMKLKSSCESGNVDLTDLTRILRVMFHEEEGQEMRRRAGKLKEVAHRATEDVFHANMHRFLQESMFLSISQSLHKTLSGRA